MDGVGIAYCLEKRVALELNDGRLQEVLTQWSSMGQPLCMYYSSQRQAQPGLRQLMDMIRSQRV